MRLIVSIVVVAALSGVAGAGKPTLAIVGLDVQARSPAAADVWIAKQLTAALRAQAATAESPYKELAGAKAVARCKPVTPACVAAAGANLGVDAVLWGRLAPAKHGGYAFSLWLVDVATAKLVRSITEVVPPIAPASRAAEIDRLAKQLYARIAGKGTHGTLLIKTDVPTGSVLVDDELVASIVNGQARIALAEGKYRVRIESEGFRAHDTVVLVAIDEESIADLDLEPTTPCEFDDPRERGDAHVANDSHAAAVVAYDEALRCKPDVGVRAKAFVAACASKQADKARAYFAGLPSKLQRKHRAACKRNGIELTRK